ncbi:MAG: hypothetical protein QM740_19115 [Acidovorax sp.]
MRYYVAGLTFTLALSMIPMTLASFIDGLVRAATGSLNPTGTAVFLIFVVAMTAYNMHDIRRALSTCLSVRTA